jgi:dTDP-4-amino-4,6-dideoxygalactose transaminase
MCFLPASEPLISNREEEVPANTDREKMEETVLQKGLNFAIAPNKIPIADILASVENGIQALDEGEKAKIRTKVCAVLTSARKPTPNISKEERAAIKSLQDNTNICILQADKGNATVVMDRVEYNTKMSVILNDKSNYKKVLQDPTKGIERKLNKKLKWLERKMGRQQYLKLHSVDGTSPRLYGKAKIHKEGVPLRPIVSYVGSPCYNVGKFLSNILEPLRKKTHQIKNVYHLKQQVEVLNIDEDEEMVSYDVVGLFPSVPRKKVIEIIKERLLNDPTLGSRTELTVDDITDLLSFVLDATAFRFNNECYEQLTGVPMGSPISVVVAEILMEEVEAEALSKPDHPTWYGRFVDDIVAKMHKDNTEKFHQNLNAICPEIQFTVEKSREGTLPFLDGEIVRNGSQLKMRVYRKPTHTDRYLNFSSHNPVAHKRAVANTLFHRALVVPTDEDDKKDEVRHVKKALMSNGYPESFVRNMLHRTVHSRSKHNDEAQLDSKPTGFTCIPYIQHVSEKIQRILAKAGVRTALNSRNTLRQKLDRLKDPNEEGSERCVVYRVPCNDCEQEYIGQTSRARKARTKEHEADCRYKRQQRSDLVEHHLRTGHVFRFNETSTVHREPNYRKRLWKESWAIRATRVAVNRKTEVTIPAQYLQFV